MQCFRDAGHIALGLIAVVVLILLALIIPAMAIFTLVGRTQKVQVCRGGVWCVGEGWLWRGKGLVCGERLDVKREGVVCGGGVALEREGVGMWGKA